MTTHRPPVAVIGNGPVGQTTALLLARWGIPSVLLDARAQRESSGSKAICQQGDVLDIWSAVGGRAIADEGLTWTTARTFYRDQELFNWSFVERGQSPLPPFVNISQTRTEAILDELIEAEPLIAPRWGHRVVGIEQDTDGVRLRCATGAGAQESGEESGEQPEEVVLEAAYAVAAGGARGDVLRESLGVGFPGHNFDDRFLICDIRAELPGWERERRFYFDPEWNPGRQVLIHPCPDSTFRIDWQVPADFDLAAEEANGGLATRIKQIVGERDYEIVWKSVYRFQSRSADRMRVGRVLLAGDCAHLVSPFGARGLNSGVADAENAAWKLAFVLRGWAPESLLETYHTERYAAAQENLAVTGETMHFLVPPDEAAWQARRELLTQAMTDVSAHARVNSGRLAEPFWYLESALTTPHPSRVFGGRPARGSAPAVVPGVLVPDAPVVVPERPDVTRLRELVRDGILVLTSPGADAEQARAALAEATQAPVSVLALADLDRTGALSQALEAGPGEYWLLRPDGHVAAIAHSIESLLTATARLTGASSLV